MKFHIFTILLFTSLTYRAQENIDSPHKSNQRPIESIITLENLQQNNQVQLKSYDKKSDSNTSVQAYNTENTKIILIGENTEQKTFESIDDYILSIEIKIKETQADDEKHQLALQNGWYTLMEKRIENAKEIKLKRSQE
jgi:hypothetical protein